MVFMPRPVCRVEPRSAPAARSGCVTRPTTECGLAKSASKVGSANSPVPIITRRINMPSLAGAAGWRRNCGLQNVGWRRRPVLFHRLRSFFQDAFQLLRRGYLAFLLFTLEVVLEFLELVPAGQAADGAHLVNEQNAVEMIDFVLPQPCFQIADAFVDDFATQVVRLHADGLGPANLLEQAGEAQAALFALDRTLALQNDGIEQHFLLIALLRIAGRIEHDDAIGQEDLVGGQAETLVFIHQFEHPPSIQVDLLIDGRQRLGRMTQRRMRIIDNLHAIPNSENQRVIAELYRIAPAAQSGSRGRSDSVSVGGSWCSRNPELPWQLFDAL